MTAPTASQSSLSSLLKPSTTAAASNNSPTVNRNLPTQEVNLLLAFVGKCETTQPNPDPEKEKKRKPFRARVKLFENIVIDGEDDIRSEYISCGSLVDVPTGYQLLVCKKYVIGYDTIYTIVRTANPDATLESIFSSIGKYALKGGAK